jgi:hypothetical protein
LADLRTEAEGEGQHGHRQSECRPQANDGEVDGNSRALPAESLECAWSLVPVFRGCCHASPYNRVAAGCDRVVVLSPVVVNTPLAGLNLLVRAIVLILSRVCACDRAVM